MNALDVLLGRRLASSEHETRQIGWFEGVAAMGLDGLGSASSWWCCTSPIARP